MTTAQRKRLVLASMLLTLLGACSPTRPPVQDLDVASRALAAARDAGASTYAAAEYRAANQHFDQAQAAEADRDYDIASQFARQSAADSELALARTRLGKARAAVEKLRQDNANLDRDLTDRAATEAQP